MLQVVWFKRDFRLLDHAPLRRATELGEVLPLYVAEPSIWHNGDLAKRHFQFVLESLRDTKQALQQIGGELFVAISEMEDVLDAIFEKYGPFHLQSHMEHGIEPTYDRDKRVKKWIIHHHCNWTEHTGFAVVRQGNAPNRKVLFQEWLKQPIHKITKNIQLPQTIPDILTNQLEILDEFNVPGEDAPKRAKGGESQAIAYAKQFFDVKYKRYNIYINKPFYSPTSSSLLAPYISWGNVSLKSLIIATGRHLDKLEQHTKQTGDDFLFKQLQAFEMRLKWHCGIVQMVENFPDMNKVALDDRFRDVRKKDATLRSAFANGKTGVPFVDACIRSLKETGWINFKQRAMLASFACNTMLLDWEEVGQTLANLFLDYDPGIHWTQIQLQAGLNPAHHIPFYDVIKQGKMHDERGDFIKRYIPELRYVSPSEIHEPWLLPKNPYLSPVIDIKQSFEDHKKILYGIKKKNK